MFKSFLNHEGHQNPISGSKVTAILLKGVDLAYWWSFIGGGSAINGATPYSYSILSINFLPNQESKKVKAELKTYLPYYFSKYIRVHYYLPKNIKKNYS